MKVAVFSDIHGNIYSFESIYQEIKKECCDMHLFLGDVCGYYYFQSEVIDILMQMPNLEAITGNHDRIFLKALEDDQVMDDYTRTFGHSMRFLKESISIRHLEFLQGLPIQYHNPEHGIAAFHGSPWNPIHQYIYPDSTMDRFDELPFKVVFLGHTHRAMDIKRQRINIVNPGSAGQPRDGGWPSYAIYDTDDQSVQLKRVKYNVEAMISEINKRNDHQYLIEGLKNSKR
jgi:putative phosphoesterase